MLFLNATVGNTSWDYDIEVKDREDGSLANWIDPKELSVYIDYLPEGFDQVEIAQGHREADTSS